MGLISVEYPVTLEDGKYKNVFPSQKRLPFKCKRLDQTIATISSGTNGVVRIDAGSSFTGVSVGDFVSWGSDGYSVRSSRVVGVPSANSIEVEDGFINSNANNGFVNFKKNWFLEIRYIDKDSEFNDTNPVVVIDSNSRIPSALDGSIDANIGLPSQTLNPDFNIATELNEGLFTEYKIQFRESWDGERSRPWISPEPHIPIMLVHATNIDDLGFTDDRGGIKRFVKGYPLLYSFVYSDANDPEGNLLRIRMIEYNIKQEATNEVQVLEQFNANGVYTLYVDTTTLSDDTVFVFFQSQITGDLGQYDGSQYDGTQYETTSSGAGEGFPFEFPFELT